MNRYHIQTTIFIFIVFLCIPLQAQEDHSSTILYPESDPRPDALYDAPPLHYDSAMTTLVLFRSTHDSLRQLVPEPLEINPDNLAWAYMYDDQLTDSFRYLEGGVGIPVSFQDKDGMVKKGFYVPYMYLDTPDVMAIPNGREIWGYPKKDASITYDYSTPLVTAIMNRKDANIMELSVNSEQMIEGPMHSLLRDVINLKYIPSIKEGAPPEVLQLTTSPVFDDTEFPLFEADLRFSSSSQDHLGDYIAIEEVIGGVFFEVPNMVLHYGDVLFDYLKEEIPEEGYQLGPTGRISVTDPVGIFEDHADFDDRTMDGDATYDPQTGVYEILGTGASGGNAPDYGHLAYSSITGDSRIKAKVSSEGPSAAYIGFIDNVHDKEATWYTVWVDFRDMAGAQAFWRYPRGTHWQTSPEFTNDLQDGLVEVVREGNVFTSYYYDRNTRERVEMDSRTIEMEDPIFVCLGSWSGSLAQYNISHFSEVQLVVESKKQVLEAQVADVNAHNTDLFIGNFAEDAVYEFVPLLESYEGREEIAGFYNSLFHSFPNFHYTLDQLVTSGNTMVTEGTVTGTHLIEWMGIPATEKSFQVTVFHIWEFEDDKIIRSTEYIDMQTVFVQLGLVDMPELPELVPETTIPDPVISELTSMQLLRQAIDKWNDHDLTGFAKMHATEAELKMGPMGPAVDRNKWTAMAELYLLAFPDNQQEIVRTIDLGDGWVLAEVIFSGTNDGPFFGIPATGRPFEVRAAHLWRYVDGLGVVGNTYWDQMTVNAQLYPDPDTSVNEWEIY